MRLIKFIILLLALSNMLQAQTDTALKQANDNYAAGNFETAAQQYEDIIANQGIAPELYYNLGNAYYRLDETAKAILNYERALRLRPNYKDAMVNLEFAQQKVTDNIVLTPSFFIKRWIEVIIKWLNTETWFYLSVITFVSGLAALLLFFFGSQVNFRRISFYGAVVLFGFSLLTLIFAISQKNQFEKHQHAIIMSGVVTIKSSPDRSGTDLFQLHEGTKVLLKTELGNWAEIEIGNGSLGWIEKKNIEQI